MFCIVGTSIAYQLTGVCWAGGYGNQTHRNARWYNDTLYQAVHQVQASQAARILCIRVHENLERLRHLLLLQLSICRQNYGHISNCATVPPADVCVWDDCT
jgi:hypothetical protein